MPNFFAFNFFFLILQLIFIFAQSSSFVSSIPLPKLIYYEILLTLCIQFLLYLLLSCWQTLLIWAIKIYNWPTKTYQKIQSFIAWDTLCAILCCNTLFFPLSLFSRTLFPEISPTIALILTGLTSVPLLGLSLHGMWILHRKYPNCFSFSLIASISIIISINTTLRHKESIKLKSSNTAPNIFIIGIDSLNPDSINQKLMPTVYSFLKQSVWFTETISPLARTYPAWSTILTGLYPKHHQAQYNLIASSTAPKKSIAWRLQKINYQTLFATDDRRFNLLDKDFGFETIIGPKRGINDILLGKFNDFPLSNLLINSSLGQWLFPYNHMNRASYFSYYPKTFDQALKKALLKTSKNQPIFMAVHFSLPHWPYAYASTPKHQLDNEFNMQGREPMYLAALAGVDQQVAAFLTTLKQQELLDHAMIILLSDHGETLYTENSRQTTRMNYQGTKSSNLEVYFAKHTSTELNKSAGHGSDLLSPAQYHCVLGFQIHDHDHIINQAHKITSRVALLDITPTLVDYLNIKQAQVMDGISLLPAIQDHTQELPKRAFILESGMFPNQFLSAEQARQLGQKIFRVTPRQGLLKIKKNQLNWLDSEK